MKNVARTLCVFTALIVHGLAFGAPITQYAIAVTSTNGTITGNPIEALGAPDSDIASATGFIQLPQSSIVLDFGSLVSQSSILRLYTFDTAAPSTANVEVSLDNISYLAVGVAKDFNGLSIPPNHPFDEFAVCR